MFKNSSLLDLMRNIRGISCIIIVLLCFLSSNNIYLKYVILAIYIFQLYLIDILNKKIKNPENK